MENFRLERRLEALLIRWEEIDQYIKRAELLHGQIVLPAVNELRHAGRYIVNAISQSRKFDNISIYEEAIICAEQCLDNADHNITESIVLFISSRINEFNLRFGRQTIIERYNPYVDLLHTLRRCQEDILSSGGNAADKKYVYDEVKNKILPQLLRKYDELIDADFIMKLQIQDERNKTRRYKYFSYVISSVCALLTFAICAFVARMFS